MIIMKYKLILTDLKVRKQILIILIKTFNNFKLKIIKKIKNNKLF
jgi:hypothetical protein